MKFRRSQTIKSSKFRQKHSSKSNVSSLKKGLQQKNISKNLATKLISGTNSIFTTQGAVISQFLRIKENFTKVLIAQSFWANMAREAESVFGPMRGAERQFQPMGDAQSLPSLLSSVFWTGWVEDANTKIFFKSFKQQYTCYSKS